MASNSLNNTSSELELHPLLKKLRKLVTNENVRAKLKQVMQYKRFQWACTYVITDEGQMVFKRCLNGKKAARIAAFGGSTDKPTNIVFAMAKLRSELADESSITISNVNCVRMYPLIVLRDGLVQIAMIKQAWMDNQTLWVPEAARGHWHWSKQSKDDITGFWEELQSERGGDLRKDLERDAGWKIESKSLNEVLQCFQGGSFYHWRDCDFDTLKK